MRTEGPVGIRGRDGGVCVAMRMREWDRRGECRRGRMSAWRGSPMNKTIYCVGSITKHCLLRRHGLQPSLNGLSGSFGRKSFMVG